MSKTKEYLFRINHPTVWVKGDGRGLSRPRKEKENAPKEQKGK